MSVRNGPGDRPAGVAVAAGGGRSVDAVRVVPVGALTDGERARWREMRAEDPRYANPFLHPAFAEACGRARNGVEVAVLERAGRPEGFFAFQRRGGGRVAEPVGGTMADVQGPVMERGTTFDLEAMLDACGLDVLEYDHLLADTPELARHHEAQDDAPTIDLSDGFEAYRGRIEAASSVFRQIDRKARKLAREHGPTRLDLRAAGEEDLQTMIAWKRRWIRARGFDDSFGQPWVERLAREIHQTREPGFEGVLSVLWAGERPVAAHLGLLGGGVFASWIPAFDPDPDLAACSPGSVLHAELCRAMAAEGVARVDLGRGENRLKSQLATGSVRLAIGAVDRRPVHRVVRAGRARLKALMVGSPIGPQLRRGVRRVRALRARGADR